MILNKHGYKRTANELAKEVVFELGSIRCYYWKDHFAAVYADAPTEKEDLAIHDAITKQLNRVGQFLGNPDPAYNKEDN